MKIKRLCAGLLAVGSILLPGCASPNAGGTASGITIIINADRLSGPGPTDAFVKIEGDGNGTATAAPETSGQTATATTSPTVEITPKAIP